MALGGRAGADTWPIIGHQSSIINPVPVFEDPQSQEKEARKGGAAQESDPLGSPGRRGEIADAQGKRGNHEAVRELSADMGEMIAA